MGVAKVLSLGAACKGGVRPAEARHFGWTPARAKPDPFVSQRSRFVSRQDEDHASREVRRKAARRRTRTSTAAMICFHRCSQERPFDGSATHAR